MEESVNQSAGKAREDVLLSILDKNSKCNKIKNHAQKVAFASILEVASKTILVFGKTLVLLVFHTIRCVISSGTYLYILDSAENHLDNFIGGL